jgi:hypothetical protein
MSKPTIFSKRKSIEFEFEFTNGDKKVFTFMAPSTKQIKKQIKQEEKTKKTSDLLEFKEQAIKDAIDGDIDDKKRMFDDLDKNGNIFDFGVELTKLLESAKAKK